MNRQQKNIHVTANTDNSMFENVQDIRSNRKLYEGNGKLESGTLTEVKLQRGIFQRKSLFPLPFVIAMIFLTNTKKVYRRLQIYKISGKDEPPYEPEWY